MYKSKSGFTIVELLIVIVVIGILAAIVIVAYSGVQQRARNSQTMSGVVAYQKALNMYATLNGSYPNTSGCLGAGYPSNSCWVGPSGNYNVNATLDTNLSSIISTKPAVATKVLQITSVDQRLGALYRYTSATDIKIIYYLEGAGQTCLSGSVGTTEMQGTQCVIVLVP
jgi:prepilin-type N-terminal cleavage/methylation domain-containing protein